MRTNHSYLIVGSGKLANHLRFFFQSQNIRAQTWSRKNNTPEQLQELHRSLDYTLLCISDSTLLSFIKENFLDLSKCVHFSGAHNLPGTLQFHPLMSFPENLFPIDFYSTIPFVGILGQPSLIDIFPFLTNPYYEIKADQKGLYHALCVLGGNFTHLLWSKVLQEFEHLNIPQQAVFPYMQQIFTNIKTNAQKNLTGPLARRDIQTLKENLRNLKDDPYFDIYTSFVKAYDSNLYREISQDIDKEFI